MDISEVFKQFIENLKVQNQDDISYKYRRITKALNVAFRETESELANSLQVGSYGRYTAIDGISDLDMIYEMPLNDFTRYNERVNNGQSELLQDIRRAILKTYPNTDIRGDGQVVVVKFTGYIIEVCPGFIQSDRSYKYPNSSTKEWKITKPRQEIEEMNNFNITTDGDLKNLARMVRAWKNKSGVKIGGLLIDTFCYNFLKENSKYQNIKFEQYHVLVRDFFEYLKNLNKDQKHWLAPGSNQKVYKKANFTLPAKRAYEKIVEAVEKNDNKTVYGLWRNVFGIHFPYPKEVLESTGNFTSKEEFIENKFPVDIKYRLNIDCKITQAGFREELLSAISMLKTKKKLTFFIKNTDTPKPYSVKWKIKNKGSIANRKGMLRGEILDDLGNESRVENSNFGGQHFVECYLIKDEVCVARDRIDVPISMDFIE